MGTGVDEKCKRSLIYLLNKLIKFKINRVEYVSGRNDFSFLNQCVMNRLAEKTRKRDKESELNLNKF